MATDLSGAFGYREVKLRKVRGSLDTSTTNFILERMHCKKITRLVSVVAQL
jgi:hypothetical protein